MSKIKSLVLVMFLMVQYSVIAQDVSTNAQPLTSTAAMALKGLLEQHPSGAAHIVASLDNSRKILDGLEQYGQLMDAKKIAPAKQEMLYKAVVKRFKGIIVDPIKEFFKLVYDYKSLLQPVIEESLCNSGINFKNSIFYKFLEAPAERVETFFDDTVNTKDELKTSCQEFAVLFGDLEATMPEAFEAGRAYLAQLKIEQEEAVKQQEESEKIL